MKLSNLFIASSVVALSALSVNAFADDAAPATSNNQVYVGAEGGWADQGFDLNKFYKNYVSTADHASSYKHKSYNMYGDVHVGALFPVADEVSIGGQLGYGLYGKQEVKLSATNNANVSDSSKESEQISDLNAQFIVQTTYKQFFGNVHGGVGYFMVHNSGEVKNFASGEVPASEANTTMAPKNKNSVRPIAGVTVGYNITDNVQAYVDYNHVFGSKTQGNFSDKVPNINTLGVGVNYVF